MFSFPVRLSKSVSASDVPVPVPVGGDPMDNAVYYDPYFGCEPCKYNDSQCYVPAPMGPNEYNQWVDKPFTAKFGVDIRQICGKDCDLEYAVDGNCKTEGVCAWTSPDFNGACGVFPVNDWESNAYVSAAACHAAYSSDPIPVTGERFPQCLSVASVCKTKPWSPYCESEVCPTNCYYETMAACQSSCSSDYYETEFEV